MDWFTLFCTALGGLGIFFYGWKALSESLQAFTGALLKQAIHKLSANRLVAIAIGTLVTFIIQSSSVTTVMVVGYVNAGLMTLTQAIGVIFGANIGATITGWIMTIKLGEYSLLLIGVGAFPMLISGNDRIKSVGKLLFGLGSIFLGLGLMRHAFTPLLGGSNDLRFLAYITTANYFSLVVTIGIGCLFTVVTQSGVLILGLTMAMASTGVLPFSTACALVLGENLGTAITTMTAGISGNVQAKRAAVAHLIFNAVGVCLTSFFFDAYLGVVDSIVAGLPNLQINTGAKPYIGYHIAASYTLFNIGNTILFTPFIGVLARFVAVLVKDRGKQPKHLQFLGPRSAFSSALGLEQAQLEIMKFAAMVRNMLIWTKDHFEKDIDDPKIGERILRYERITDNIHQEMIIFSGVIIKSELNSQDIQKINILLKMSDELESLADYCQRLLSYSRRLKEENVALPNETAQNMRDLFDMTISYYQQVHDYVKESEDLDAKTLASIKDEFNVKANQLRNNNFLLIKEDKLPPLATLTIVDITLSLSRILSHSKNIVQAWSGKHTLLVE
jgi:phosphate:Na+ symporter